MLLLIRGIANNRVVFEGAIDSCVVLFALKVVLPMVCMGSCVGCGPCDLADSPHRVVAN